MNDLYLSGEINNDMARYFASELKWYDSPLTVHINSAGGDPFAAIAMAHTIRHSDKEIEISVEGLCASAAILILCSGRRVKSAFNSLFMIHGTSVMLEDSYNLGELEKIKSSLEKVQEAIEKTLSTRLKDFDLSKETWLSADEALGIGLIDEITSAQVEMKVDAKQKLIFANNHFFKLKGEVPAMEVDANKIRNQIRSQELKRLRGLQELKCANSAVNALIEVAIEKGASVEEVKDYVAAIKNVKKNPLRDLLADQMQSGAGGVKGARVSAEDIKAAQMQRIINAANGSVE